MDKVIRNLLLREVFLRLKDIKFKIESFTELTHTFILLSNRKEYDTQKKARSPKKNR